MCLCNVSMLFIAITYYCCNNKNNNYKYFFKKEEKQLILQIRIQDADPRQFSWVHNRGNISLLYQNTILNLSVNRNEVSSVISKHRRQQNSPPNGFQSTL